MFVAGKALLSVTKVFLCLFSIFLPVSSSYYKHNCFGEGGTSVFRKCLSY